MRRLFAPGLVLSLALFVLGPASGLAASGSQSYQLHLELPNVSQASNGDRVSVTGEGEFSIHPNSATASGGVLPSHSRGTGLPAGTGAATRPLDVQADGRGGGPKLPAPGGTAPPPPDR